MTPTLAHRLAALEDRARAHSFRFTLPGGRTVDVPADDVLAVMLGDEMPPTLARVVGTQETAELARSVVDLARAHRAGGADE
ncbi:hypothetical protein RM572_26945 [Streptomyces sp. DSM 42041]|uniref:Uncharacterized protein n=1 Tax=Streptomyces hazeniae TaxID=3075538 RepID=A0ABU2P0X7_9ACTN|nr:hypothetical protein [Streptomyces sp. DSM 42041]MDT0382402.1 hypothetical protein [Streptomyces sp. DSM 42041]